MQRNRLVAAAAIGLVAALTLGACAGDGGGEAEGGAVLTVGMPNGTQTENQNPFVGTSSASSLGYAFAIYEPLLQVNPTDFSQDPVPWLAESFSWNEDYTAVTFTVRQDVLWSDGETMTPEDVAYSFEIRRDNEALNTGALPIGDVTVDGDDVTVQFDEPQFITQTRVLNTFVVPEHIWSAFDDPATELNLEPVGTGPYTLTSWTTQAAILDARDDYWGGEPAVPQLRYTSYTDNNALTTALASGEVQWGWTFIADIEDVYVSNDPEHYSYWAPPGLGIDALFLNTATAPFDDVAVRQALNLVVDRDAISQQATSDLFPPITSPTGISQPAGDPFIDDAYADATLDPDVDAARAILEEAGYTWDGDGTLLDEAGEPVTFTLVDPSGWNDYLTALSLIAEDAAELGIDAEVETMTVDGWMAAIGSGDFQATMHWTDTGSTPWDVYSNTMSQEQLVPLGENAAWNFGRFESAEAGEALATYASSSDPAVQEEALATLQQIFVEQVPALPIVTKPFAAEFSTANYVGWPSDEDPYNHPQPTGPQVSQVLMHLEPAEG